MVSLLNDLRTACRQGAARQGLPTDAVGGVSPRWVATPASTPELAGVLRLASEHGLSVVPRGAATKLDWGGSPMRVDIAVETVRLTGVRVHTPDDLVATVGAGTGLNELQAALAKAGQRLALDPGSATCDTAAAGPTIGGVLATSEAGPLRMRYGTGRDLLIGVEFVRADGTTARAGGRVVKNVAGYDLGKLLCGSFGTLGVLTEATFRLHPLPSATAWVCRSMHDARQLRDLVAAVSGSTVAPSAVEVDLPGTGVHSVDDRPGCLAVLVEGAPAGVATRADTLVRLLGGDAVVAGAAPSWWGRYPFRAGEVALKLVTPVAELSGAVEALRDAAGDDVPVRGSAGTGVVFSALPGDLPPHRIQAVLGTVRSSLHRGGSCVVLTAAAPVRATVDMWGPASGWELMRRVKDQFDPGRVLSPGRFVGGL